MEAQINECSIQVTEFIDGYPNLAAFQNSSENFSIYRQFGYLQSRVLLDKQDKLRLLEEQLDAFDRANIDCGVSREPNDEIQDMITERNELLRLVDVELSSYGW